jgi:hypothetical protein
LPGWRPGVGKPATSKDEQDADSQDREDFREGRAVEGDVSLEEAAFLSIEHKIPIQLGKYRIVPPGAETKSGDS